MNEFLQKSLQKAKRAVIALTGFTVLLVGAAMIFLPGPAVLIIPAGLAILATEFVWARRLLKKVKERLISSQERFFTRSPK
jgi:uncharacterized protein (TIGR02611 family)